MQLNLTIQADSAEEMSTIMAALSSAHPLTEISAEPAKAPAKKTTKAKKPDPETPPAPEAAASEPEQGLTSPDPATPTEAAPEPAAADEDMSQEAFYAVLKDLQAKKNLGVVLKLIKSHGYASIPKVPPAEYAKVAADAQEMMAEEAA
jgi:hypothetical protein